MAQVVIVGVVGTLERLTYAVPESIAAQLAPGHRVLVPLRSRRVTAIVTQVSDNLDSGGAVPKAIIELLEPRPLFDQAHLQLIEFLASYYMAPIGEAFRNVLPSLARVESRRIYELATAPNLLAQVAFTPLEQEIINALTKHPMTMRQLGRLAEPGEIKTVIAHLMADGWIASRDATRGRHRGPTAKKGERRTASESIGPLEPLVHSDGSAAHPRGDEDPISPLEADTSGLQLTAEQAAAVSAVTHPIRQRQFEPFLLWGVTASGKSEVYIRLASEALSANRQILVLVPEIALADQLVGSFRNRFGPLVAVAHSAQNVAERWASWMAALNGDARIMIGPRSAIFAPISDLGLIVVDEEHDSAYKQEEGIRYNARDLAVVLARLASCPVVLGSATPSAESYANGRRGRYRMLQLMRRVQEREFARVEIIDLRQQHAALGQTRTAALSGRETAHGTPGPNAFAPPVHKPLSGGRVETAEGTGSDAPDGQVPLSPPLIEALRENLAAEGQSLVFLNRRGYHNFLQCHLCGNVITCANCSVSMTFHLRGRTLRCHYCGASEPAPEKCFACGGFGLEGQGFGTERLVHALARLFPSARIDRMDSDTSGRRGARSAILRSVRNGNVDILVGTQMITKGLDFHNVTLVAVVLADLSLNMPDFRSAERTFQLLTQAAGRAGRGERLGRVLIQTYAPHHYSVRAAREQDYARFIRREMELRRELMYPPFARLALVRIEGDESAHVSEDATKITALFAHTAKPESMRVLGPAPAPIERIKQRYRWQVLLKARERHELRAALAEVASYPVRDGVRVSIDIDPLNML
ncbi:MAG: primosomal protein N' [Deltaproteobacteria bacterium]|nr:primosomal protein N' [Deltaproteobacteria bacterium]